MPDESKTPEATPDAQQGDAQQEGATTTPQPDPPWIVVAEPVGDNPALKPEAAKERGRERLTAPEGGENEDNVGGIVFYLQRTRGAHTKEEVARVGFIREASENPDAKFEDKLAEVEQLARTAVDTLNRCSPNGALL